MAGMRLYALISLVVIAVVGSILIVLIPAIEPTAQVENTVTRLTVFLGPIITVLLGFLTVSRQVDNVSNQVQGVENKVNGHLQKVTATLVAAVADHPDVAEKAEQAGLTLPSETVTEQSNDTHS